MAQRRSLIVTILTFSGLLLAQPPASAETAPTALAGSPSLLASVEVDPVDDPWLSEQGPAAAKPVEVPREQVLKSWQEAPERAHPRAASLRRVRLELGLGDLPVPAQVIAAQASDEEPEVHTQLALDLAPGVPAYQIDHAVALWRSGDIGAAVLATGSAVWAVALSLFAQLWLLENVAFFVLIVVLSASLAFILLAALQVFSHAAHDLGDLLSSGMPVFARFAALAALVLTPLLLGEGLLGLAVGLFAVGFAYGGTRQRSVLAMSAALLVIALHPMAQFVSAATSLVDQDPVAKSVISVLAGTETQADVERLELAFEGDLAAAHALAYRARRYGMVELSRERLESISERAPDDAVALANLGNIEMRRGETEQAIEFYERSAAGSDSPVLLFDLSQAYANAFRMEEYEATLVHAQHLGDAEVSALSSLGDASLVSDLGFPMALLQDRLRSVALSERSEERAISALAPGRLGDAWYLSAGAFLLVALLSLLLADRWDHASQCGRCGHRICTRCEETVWSDEICEDCHYLFQNPEATDPSLRMARLQALAEREVGIERIWLAVSLFIPGMAGFASRRPDFALFGLLLFCWIAVWAVWPSGIFEDPMLMGSAAVLCFAIPGLLAVFAYASLVCVSLIARKNR